VKTNVTPASAKARALLAKLEALAERGIDGEKLSAQRKIARLKARFDFSQPGETPALDLFSGNFKRSRTARKIHAFGAQEFAVANAVKWAVESAAKVSCIYRNGDLLAEATAPAAKRLAEIAAHIAGSFRALIEQFGGLDGVSAGDRNVFVMGLYDGMMGETRNPGERLPARPPVKKARKARPAASTPATGLHVHPYTVGLSLGRQIRFSAPLEQITAELAEVTRKPIASS
jgi:hypothetical protein